MKCATGGRRVAGGRSSLGEEQVNEKKSTGPKKTKKLKTEAKDQPNLVKLEFLDLKNRKLNFNYYFLFKVGKK